jgi:hypothetical protein
MSVTLVAGDGSGVRVRVPRALLEKHSRMLGALLEDVDDVVDVPLGPSVSGAALYIVGEILPLVDADAAGMTAAAAAGAVRRLVSRDLFALTHAANFLDAPALLSCTCREFVRRMRGRTPAQMASMFNIPRDLDGFPQTNEEIGAAKMRMAALGKALCDPNVRETVKTRSVERQANATEPDAYIHADIDASAGMASADQMRKIKISKKLVLRVVHGCRQVADAPSRALEHTDVAKAFQEVGHFMCF